MGGAREVFGCALGSDPQNSGHDPLVNAAGRAADDEYARQYLKPNTGLASAANRIGGEVKKCLFSGDQAELCCSELKASRIGFHASNMPERLLGDRGARHLFRSAGV